MNESLERVIWEGRPDSLAYHLDMIFATLKIVVMLWVSCAVFVFSFWAIFLGRYPTLTLEVTFRIYAFIGALSVPCLLFYLYAQYPNVRFIITESELVVEDGFLKKFVDRFT
jgi:membrane protein YdbS with pleckstrin-like domain